MNRKGTQKWVDPSTSSLQLERELEAVEQALEEQCSPLVEGAAGAGVGVPVGASTTSSASVAAAMGNNNNNRNSTVTSSNNSSITSSTSNSYDNGNISNNNSNNNNDNNNINNISESTFASNGGRAVFESLSSALTSIRRRFQQQRQGGGQDDDPEEDDRRSIFSERLESVERAHSTRIPLHLLRQQQQQQQQNPETIETWPTSAVQDKGAFATSNAAADATAAANSYQSRSGSNNSGSGSGNESEEGGSAISSSSSSSALRRESTLVASRRYAQAQENNEMALHEDGMATTLSKPTVDEEERGQGDRDHPMVDASKEDGMEVENRRQQGMTLYMPMASLQKMVSNTHQGSILRSTPSLSTLASPGNCWMEDVETEPTDHMVLVPAVYSWGPPSPHFDLLEVDEEKDERPSSTTNKSNSITGAMSTISTPTRPSVHSRVGRSEITSVSLGESHVALATASGALLVCGDNSEGAVDPSSRGSCSSTWSPPSKLLKDASTIVSNKHKHNIIRRPMLLESIMTIATRVLQVACGWDHTALTTDSRSVLTFGNNLDGQLGHRIMRSRISSSTTMSPGSSWTDFRFQPPAALVLPGGKKAAQIACGHRFTLVLTTRLQVYICGREEISGSRYMEEVEAGRTPPLARELPSLQGLPLVYVEAGHDHAVVLTAHGTAYAWGNNVNGACGREFPIAITVPEVLTAHGTAYAWGNNVNGACGREFPTAITVPVPFQVPVSQCHPPHGQVAPFINWAAWDEESHQHVTLAKDVAVVDAACGNNATVLVTHSGQLLVAGWKDPQQQQPSSSVVQILLHPAPGRSFVSAQAGSTHAILLDDQGDVWSMDHDFTLQPILTGKSIATIAAGGTQSLAIATSTPTTMMIDEPIHASRTSTPDLEGLLDGILLETEVSKQQSAVQELVDQTKELFRSPAVMNSVFLDPQEIDRMYKNIISAAGEQKYRQQVVSAIEEGMVQGLESIKNARLMYPEAVRCLMMYLQCPLFREPAGGNIQFDARGETVSLLCETILGLTFEGYKALTAWSKSMYSKDFFIPFLVKPLVHQLNAWIEKQRTRAVPVIIGVLRWFQNVAERFPEEVDSKQEDFYSSGIENMSMEALFEDLIRYKRSPKDQRSAHFFVCANPFLMSPRCKRNLLQIENQMTMVRAAQTGGVEFDLNRRQFLFNPFFVLAIDRQYMLQQTLQAVACASPSELRKSLKVVFKGEEGIDAGGVTKEFFQLLVVQLFDINTGMWSTNLGDMCYAWFNADCSWNQDGYFLVGILVGLAVYNGVILDVHFPQAIYRKLLGLPLGLEDMVDPEVQKGLQSLLDYQEDDVEEVFCLTFEVTWNSLGVERKKDLKLGGGDIPVTSDNKEEYVLLYVKWLLVDSIQRQYIEFERGFMQVMEGSSLDLLKPEELELLVVGTPELDFAALEENTEYEGGYDKNAPVVQNLWRFVKESPLETQLKFLKFSTGTTKAPIGGLGAMPFKIQRAGPDSMQLPTSHTCFNTLLVPDYGEDIEKLKDRLGRAIIECEGFGLT